MSSVLIKPLADRLSTALRCESQSVKRDDGNMLDIPAKLRVALKRADITARDLAKLIRMSESIVSLWLSGERTPRMKNLEKIAKALGIEMDELWNGSEARPANKAQLAVIEDMDHLTTTQQEAIAGMVRSMRADR